MTERAMQLKAADGQHILAVRQQTGHGPGVLFLHGFRSDMTGTKGDYLAQLCASRQQTFTRLDLRGHGQSGGHYTDFTLSDWLADVVQVLDECTQGPQIIVGSSLGGWLMLLLAKVRPARIQGLIGLAAAPDFTTELLLPALTPAQKAEYEQTGRIVEETTPEFGPNIFTRALIEDARHHLILTQPLAFNGPVRLLQGMQDDAVPWAHAFKIVQAISGNDVRVTLFKDAGHRIAEPPQLFELGRAVEELSGVQMN